MSKTSASNWAGMIGSALIVCVCCHVGQPLIGIGGVVVIWVLRYLPSTQEWLQRWHRGAYL